MNNIEEYYINLNYEQKIRKKEASLERTDMSKDMCLLLMGDNFKSRLTNTCEMLDDYMSLFQSVCNHADVPNAIKEYINCYVINIIKFDDFTSEKAKQEIWTLMLTLLNFCGRHDVQFLLETYIIKNSSLDTTLYAQYKKLLSHRTIEIILLEDSDLYVLISYLKTSENSQNISKIWIPQSIKKLLTPPTFNKINVTSIWSEDITVARALAASLDRNIVLINTLDFYDSTVIAMPYIEIFKGLLNKPRMDEEQYIISRIKPASSKKKFNIPANKIYNLMFYDGTWQKPIKNTYWLYNDVLRANATSDDISKCVVSARRGFKVWGALSIESRMQVLSKFASVLEYIGKPELSEIVFKWIKFPHWYMYSLVAQGDQSLIAKTRKPKGVITLMEKEDTDLFRKLTQSLIIGNSVIVICTTRSYNITQYCDMFSSLGIPPGVINLLSCKNAKPLNERYDASALRDISSVYRQQASCNHVLEILMKFNVHDEAAEIPNARSAKRFPHFDFILILRFYDRTISVTHQSIFQNKGKFTLKQLL